MNLLQITPRLEQDGPWAIEHALAVEARNKGGQSVIVSSNSPDDPRPKEIEAEGIAYCQAEAAPTAQITKIIKSHDINIIHAHTAHTAFAGHSAKLIAYKNIPVCSTIHGWNPNKKPVMRRRDAIILNVLDYSVAVSNAVRNEMIGYGVSQDKIGVIHNGLNMARCDAVAAGVDINADVDINAEFNIPADAKIIGCVARLDPVKGHAVLLHALPSVIKAFPDCHVLIIGDVDSVGPEHRRGLEKLSADLGLSDKVHFTGQRDDALAMIRNLDILVQPSLYEPFGLMLIEAMYFGVPVIATNVGGIPEIITHMQEGLLVPPNGPGELSGAIIALVENVPWQRKLGEAGNWRVRNNFTIEQMTASYFEMYERLIEEITRGAEPIHNAIAGSVAGRP